MSLGPHEEATPIALPAASGPVVGSHAGHYLGAAVRETGGTNPIRVTLYDNASAASGPIIDEIECDAGKTADPSYPPPGRYVGNGIYAQYNGTGVVEGSVFQ